MKKSRFTEARIIGVLREPEAGSPTTIGVGGFRAGGPIEVEVGRDIATHGAANRSPPGR